MHETRGDLESLQRLLDESYARAGPHLRAIHTAERRMVAADLCGLLVRVSIWDLATVTRAVARLAGASLVIGVDSVPSRLAQAKRMGADVALDFRSQDVVAEIKRLTGGGVDVAIEALGQQETFENCLRAVRPGGVVSSLGVYSGHLQVRATRSPPGSATTRS